MQSSGGRLRAGIGVAGPRVSSPFFPWRGYRALAACVASRRHLPAGAAVAVGLVLWGAARNGGGAGPQRLSDEKPPWIRRLRPDGGRARRRGMAYGCKRVGG